MFSAFFFLTAVAIWTDLSKAEDCNFTDDFTGQYIIDQGNVRLEVCPDSFLKIGGCHVCLIMISGKLVRFFVS